MGYQETEIENEGELAEGWRNISSHQLLNRHKKDMIH